MVKHLRESNMGYWKHWCRAMKISLALFIPVIREAPFASVAISIFVFPNPKSEL